MSQFELDVAAAFAKSFGLTDVRAYNIANIHGTSITADSTVRIQVGTTTVAYLSFDLAYAMVRKEI